MNVCLQTRAAMFTALAGTGRAAFVWFSAVLLIGTHAQAQSALDGFNPNANGAIQAVAVQKDGKILIGGDFTELTPSGGPTVFRNHIARLNPDGTLDTTFDPRANGTVRTIVIQRDGRILIGGDFTVLNATPRFVRNHIARLNPTTGVADSFNPNANATVRSIAVQSDGNVIAGGDFTTISGKTRNHIVRVTATTGSPDAFDPNANATVRSIAVQLDGAILAGGDFTVIGGQTRRGIARLEAIKGLADSFNPNGNGSIFSIALQADGAILVGGKFTAIGGQTRHFIARLNKEGVADSFDPDSNNEVFSLALQGDGKILAGGAFTKIGGQGRNHIARLDGLNKGLADSFDPNANSVVLAVAVQQDGKVLAGGTFTSLMPDGSPFAIGRNFIARLEIDGRADRTLEIGGFNGLILATAVQTDGKILIGGSFNNVLGLTCKNIARLNTDGTIDELFNPLADNLVFTIAVQPDGKILIGGDFTTLTPNFGFTFNRNHIARLNQDGTVDTSFNPNANGQVGVLALQADGKILVGGNGGGFTTIGGQSRRNLARLDPVTGLADSFNPNPQGGEITSMVVQSDTKILVGGSFHGPTGIAGQSRRNLARLNADGSLDTSFQPEPDDFVTAVALQGDRRIVVGGHFRHIGGAARNFIARVDPTIGIADGFDPNAGNEVDTIAIQSDGKVLVGGFFDSIGGFFRNHIARLDGTTGAPDSFAPNANGQVAAINLLQDGKVLAAGFYTVIGQVSRDGFARLSNDTAALQNLSATQSNITLTRGGSSPQYARAIFEFSTDNQNFTFVGDATPAGTSWTLTGANLPTGQDIVVRARGFYPSGFGNASESAVGTRHSSFFPGNFVIGDRNAVVGKHVVFWSAQWANLNSLSGGPAPADFKGFADSADPNPPACGGTWSSNPGNSSALPSSVPATINVIVASSITKSGAVISGDIPQMAVVQTDPGYDSSAGHAGTGTVLSVGCGE